LLVNKFNKESFRLSKNSYSLLKTGLRVNISLFFLWSSVIGWNWEVGISVKFPSCSVKEFEGSNLVDIVTNKRSALRGNIFITRWIGKKWLEVLFI